MNTDQHLTSEDLRRFVRGDDTDDASLRTHVRTCEHCQAALQQEAQTELMMETVASSVAMCPSCQRTTEDERCDHCGSAIRPGGYFVERVLVESQHGRLYLARDENGRRLALKELVFTQVPDIGTLTAFEREAKLLRELDHPGIPRFITSFREGEGVRTRLYLAQEFIDGPSLAQHLETHRFTESELMRIAARVLEILVYLQSISPPIFHRDVKPANLIMKPDGSVALVDFGAARDLGATGGASLVGTFGYIPPEQLVGVVDTTSDLYALGATLLHLATRRPPWQLITQTSPLASARLSESFGTFMQKLCAQDRRERFADAREALVALRSGNTKTASSSSFGYVLGAVAAVVVGAGAIGGWYAMSDEPEPPPLRPAVVTAAPLVPKPPARTTTKPNRNLLRHGVTAVAIADRVLAIGGQSPQGAPEQTVLSWSNGVWRSTGMQLQGERYGATATLLSGAEILVVGGDPSLRGVEICNLTRTQCSKTTPTLEPRKHHQAVPLPSGRILVVGGTASPYTAEIYDPNTWRWKRATPPPRSGGRPARMVRRDHGLPIEAYDIHGTPVARYVEANDDWAPTDEGRVAPVLGPDEFLCSDGERLRPAPAAHRNDGFAIFHQGALLVAGGGMPDAYFRDATTLCKRRPAVPAPPPRRKVKRRRIGGLDDVESIFRTGNQYLMRGELKSAEKALLKCISLDPRHAKCHRSLGVLYAQFDDYKKSVSHYRQYLKLAPDGPEAKRIRQLIEESSSD